MKVSGDRVWMVSAHGEVRAMASTRRATSALHLAVLLGVLLGATSVGPLLLGARTAHAQDAGAGTTGRETEFVAMTGPARESVPGGVLMVSAYAAILLLLAAYVGRLALQQASTSKELARLDAALRARGGGEVPAKTSAEKPK